MIGLVLAAGGSRTGRAEDATDDALRAELLKLNGATTEETQTAKLRELVRDRQKAKRAVALAARMLKDAKDETPFNLNGVTILGRAAHIVKDYDAAERFYELQIELAAKIKNAQKLILAYENLIDLYFDTKQYDQAVETCERALDVRGPMEWENAKAFILERLVQAKAKQGKTDEALNMAKGLMEATGNRWYFLQLKGWVEREAGRLDDAIASYLEAMNRLEAERKLEADLKDRFKDRIRYILSGLYVENKEIDKAAKQLQMLIERHPDNPTYKNDLGFIWCDNDMNLEQSEKLIKEALELDRKQKEKLKAEGKIDEVRENAAYLDSLGWVYYKQKRYNEALEPLKKAAADEDEGNHLEIWDHLGDCYMALGKVQEAIATWEKALKMEDISKRDAERRRKVTEKLKKARASLVKVRD